MKKALLIILSIVLILALIVVGVGYYIVNTPQYALKQMMDDIKLSGMEGLRPHLTDEAGKTMDAIVSGSGLVGGLISLINGGEYITVLKDEIQKVKWELVDMMKGKNGAEAVLGFNYEDKLVGTIEISMIRQDGQWKIDGLEMPEFDKIDFERT